MTVYDADIAYDSDIPYDGVEAANAGATLTALYPAPTYPHRPKVKPQSIPDTITGHGGIGTISAPTQYIAASVSGIEPIVARCYLSSPARGFCIRATIDNAVPIQIRADDEEIVSIIAAILAEESIRESAKPTFETSYKVNSSIVP